MSTKNGSLQKIKAALKLVQAQLAEFEAQQKSLTAPAHIKHARLTANIQQKYGARQPNEDVWDLLRYCY